MEAISDFSLHGETVQEVLWMSKSVRANACMSDGECVGVFLRTRKALCVCVCFGVSVAVVVYLKAGQADPGETSDDWMIDAGQWLSLINGLRHVSN